MDVYRGCALRLGPNTVTGHSSVIFTEEVQVGLPQPCLFLGLTLELRKRSTMHCSLSSPSSTAPLAPLKCSPAPRMPTMRLSNHVFVPPYGRNARHGTAQAGHRRGRCSACSRDRYVCSGGIYANQIGNIIRLLERWRPEGVGRGWLERR
jgi:hypothetical protein